MRGRGVQDGATYSLFALDHTFMDDLFAFDYTFMDELIRTRKCTNTKKTRKKDEKKTKKTRKKHEILRIFRLTEAKISPLIGVKNQWANLDH